MLSKALIPFLGAIVLLAGTSFADPAYEKGCESKTFLLDGAAYNRVLLGEPRQVLSSFEQFSAFVSQDNGNRSLNATRNLRGYSCKATKPHSKYQKPLLIFSHGATYTSEYWSALKKPEVSADGHDIDYSWVNYAANQGYEILAIDNLGNGGSDHPDPITEVQQNLQAALYASLAAELRSSHDFIGWVGHSLGSFLGVNVATTHPNLIDAFILTGAAVPKMNNLPAEYNAHIEVASDYSPQHFPASKFPPGYTVIANRTAREELFHAQPNLDYDPAIAERDNEALGTATLGEVATQSGVVADKYFGSVFVMAGQKDAVLCGDGTRESADCAQDQLTNFIQSTFPNARRTGSFLQPRSGHNMMLHYSWKQGVEKAHEFLG